MTESGPRPRSGSRRAGLPARAAAVLVSPRQAFGEVAARPHWLGMALLIVAVAAACSGGFLATEVGRLALFDQQVRQIESVGRVMTDEMYTRLEESQRYMPYLAVGGILVGWPLAWLLLSAVLMAVFNGVLGGTATFRQVLAIVVHSRVVLALRALFVAPIDYARESTGGASSLGVLFPMLGEGSFPARLLEAIDLFSVWGIALLAIGLGVLYRRRAGPIAAWLFGAFAAGVLVLAAVQAIRGGA